MSAGASDGIRSFFEPRSVAVAGVSTDPDKLGSIIFSNLIASAEKGLLKASVYAVNPSHERVGTRRCYPSVAALPEVPELLIIAVPVSLSVKLVAEAAEAGVRAVVLVASGYAEAGRRDLEDQIRDAASKTGMRILGPNTIGLLDTVSGVDSLFLRSTKRLPGGGEVVSLLKPLKGGVAIVTQSGHLGEIISENLAADGVGIRALVGTGNQLDVSVADMIRHFADDERTKVISVYLEGVDDGRTFMRAAAYASKRKPLIVFKVGKTGTGARAALTHTASMVGDYHVFRAALRQSGAVEANTLQELVDYSASFSILPPTRGGRLVVVTNAGGVGAVAADQAAVSGLDAAPISRRSEKALSRKFSGSSLATNAALGNPIDLTASATSEEFVAAAEFALGLPEYDMALLLPTHQTPAIDSDIGARIAAVVSKARKPVCVCVMGRSPLAEAVHKEFFSHGIPSFPTPERAVKVLSALYTYRGLRGRARAPVRPRGSRPLRKTGRAGPLPQYEVQKILGAYGIPEPKSAVVHTLADLKAAAGVGFPAACKLLSRDLVHKTDAGGVALNVGGAPELKSTLSRFIMLSSERGMRFDGMLVQRMVRPGVEFILGGTRDRTFGPTVLVGSGGTLTELVRDGAVAVAPVTVKEARGLVLSTRAGSLAGGYRGGPGFDLSRLSGVVSRFSRILAELPQLAEIELNPLIANSEGVFAVDYRATAVPSSGDRRGP